jgi:two-component system, OmpR family, phosphate regulon sensor histidine kinase PhoR
MKTTLRVLTALLTALVILDFLPIPWAHGAFWNNLLFLLFGAFLGIILSGFFPDSKDASPGPAPPDSRNGSIPESPPSSAVRDVPIPGRNFDEMRRHLGSGESMLDVVLNSMGEGVLLLNQADRVVLVNPAAAKILETGEKEILGRLYIEVVRNPVLADLLTRSKREGGISSGEMEISGRDEKTFAVSVAAIRSVQGTHLGQIVVFSDITSLKRLMRMRTEFAANVSHELKTPLTAILGYVETLLSGAIDDRKNRGQFLRKISEQAERLHSLIADVLELSSIESGAFIISLGEVDLAEAAQQAVEVLRAKWEAKEMEVLQEIPAGTRVTGHPEGLFHVLENLLDNAVKYSPNKSRIRIFSRAREDGRIEFGVEDQGSGIPPEARRRIFERFFRVDVSRSREAGGTGLGLSIVKHLVEKMEGEVSVESEEGKGSVFTVTLDGPKGRA